MNIYGGNETEQYDIPPEKAAKDYDPYFSDAYWLGSSAQLPFLPKPEPRERPSSAGKNFLKLLGLRNNGMSRLPKPTKVDQERLYAEALEPGAIVKAFTESLYRTDEYDRMGETLYPRYTAAKKDGGFIVRKFKTHFGAWAAFSRTAEWYAVAEARSGGNALFPLLIDHDSSVSSGIYEDFIPILRFAGKSHIPGVRVIHLNTSVAINETGASGYTRVYSANTYTPA